MKLSIIVPVYNVRRYLNKCLESINNQTYEDYEVIVIDDGSTDGSSEIIDTFCSDKKKFRVIHKKNEGLMATWMEGVNKATGQYLGFVDSDDYIDVQMFEKLAECAQNYNCDIVMCDRYDVIKEKVKHNKSCIAPGLYLGDSMNVIYESILPTFGGEHITNARWNKLFKRELLLENIKYCKHKSRICEDRFITPACVFSAKSFYYLQEPLYYYVFREGSNHSKASEKLYDTMELLYTMQKKMLLDKEMYEKYRNSLERARLNYLRLMIMRNFSGKDDYEKKKEMARKILNNDCYRDCIKKYNNDLNGKLGIVLKILFQINKANIFVKVCSYIDN